MRLPEPETLRGRCGPVELCLEANTFPVPAAREPWPLLVRYAWLGLNGATGAILRAGIVWDVAMNTTEECLCEQRIGDTASGEMRVVLPLGSRPLHDITNVNALVFSLVSEPGACASVPGEQPTRADLPGEPQPPFTASFFFSGIFTEQGELAIQFYRT